uniref:MaoC-like domain-containing protein n=1 Tax=Dunaliella tertiolecta TaxID=3047 RepID=A0A7S3QPC0_DUNTE|eukprot:CAMPEP_0202379490 /NCGR_PEP_ID=MMETSP1127-20130417/24351_1 /ASSEMBLY_ACC=CAM_ASM_000462 /TAXON_ID=3047 /ORGANISM="Dunaliella tertiolecta, Strain CCMP1320" /LENGTH=385 /DNA_ID=CAMNT_0048978011 /DNA_START=46 /DNA_END=1203 /DNA_ORIENTATION=+
MLQDMDVHSLRERRFGTYHHKYTQRDLILYALAVGCTTKEDLQFLYEAHEAAAPLPNSMGLSLMPAADQASVPPEHAIVVSAGRGGGDSGIRRPPLGRLVAVTPFPTWGIVAAHPALMGVPLEQYIPGFDKNKALHGEQWMQLLAPIPASGELVSRPQLVDVQDKGKGKGVVAVVRTTTSDALSGRVIAINEFTVFALGAGGFGGSWPPAHRPPGAVSDATPPNRPPDFQAQTTTSIDQAALYRVASGDWNPLHIDARAAKAAGLPCPILHGLCNLGIAARLVAHQVAGGDASCIRSIKARFASPCFPGETLHVQIWRAKDVPASALTGSLQLQRFVFEVFVEREGQGRVVVVKNAAVELARGGWQCEQGCKGQGEAATNWVSRL